MREVNFSIPNANKASVGITTALYDRRALDCTSTLPLINSLNHLAYLTSSSLRIRDILVVDGGLQRLVAILKRGRSNHDMMCMWKWNLAFQCVINLGVRGTEIVRTRVVEADLIPVLSTILDNYNRIVDRCREKADEARSSHTHSHVRSRRSHGHSRGHSLALPPSADPNAQDQPPPPPLPPLPPTHSAASTFTIRPHRQEADASSRHRRQRPPPLIDISSTPQNVLITTASTPAVDIPSHVTPPPRWPPHNSPPERSHLLSLASLQVTPVTVHTPTTTDAAVSSRNLIRHYTASNLTNDALAGRDALARPFHNIDRLGVMNPFGHLNSDSLPNSPTTPVPPSGRAARDPQSTMSRSRRRPSLRHQYSTTDPSDVNEDSLHSDDAPDPELDVNQTEIVSADFDDTAGSAIGIQDITMEDADVMLTDASLVLDGPTPSETQETIAFNINHPGGPADGTGNPVVPAIGLATNRPSIVSPPPPPNTNPTIPRFLVDHYFIPPPEVLAALPREEDVLMTLQLLAYISKYSQLREYFLKTHLVPRLRVIKEMKLLDGAISTLSAEPDPENLAEEYLQPDIVNMFPIVEKFTLRSHSPDMQYWAGVVMRNLCRKDEKRGGIRQCAHYQCGKWEEYSRQFAKCRRCRRTKYCSKDCQKAAWLFHRHWCHANA